MFEDFQKFLGKAAHHYGIGTEIEAAKVCQQFRTLIPEIFKGKESVEEYVEPAFFKNSILVINVANPAWAQEVIMRKTKIIDEMNKKAGQKVIKNLRTQLKQKSA